MYDAVKSSQTHLIRTLLIRYFLSISSEKFENFETITMDTNVKRTF